MYGTEFNRFNRHSEQTLLLPGSISNRHLLILVTLVSETISFKQKFGTNIIKNNLWKICKSKATYQGHTFLPKWLITDCKM